MQRDSELLSNSFGSESLAYAWGTRKETDDAFAFAGDKVIESWALELRLGEGKDKFLLVRRQDEFVEGVEVPLDLLHLFDEEVKQLPQL